MPALSACPTPTHSSSAFRPIVCPIFLNFFIPHPASHRILDIFHRLRPTYHRHRKLKAGQAEYCEEPDPKKQMTDARHLAKYVFPREFGLSHVFDPSEGAASGSVWKYRDWTDREKEICVRLPLPFFDSERIEADRVGRLGERTM
jgi:hypothetical protein